MDGISFTVHPWRSLQPLDRKRAAGSDRGRRAAASYGPCLVMRRSRRLLPSRAPASCGDDSTGHRWRGRGPHCRRRRRRRRPRRRSRGLARCPRSTAPWRAKQPEIASTALPSLSDHLRIEELRLTSPQGSFFPVAGRTRHPCLFSCGARPIRCSCSYVIAVLLGPRF